MPDLTAFQTLVHDHKELLAGMAVVSGVLFVGCLVVTPWLAAYIPTDYFLTDQRPSTDFADNRPALRWTVLIVKNLIGVLLILAGIIMLVLPGQGILTMMMGILLMNFPGKHALERRIIRIPSVLASINWLRNKRGAAPLLVSRPVPQSDLNGDSASSAISD